MVSIKVGNLVESPDPFSYLELPNEASNSRFKTPLDGLLNADYSSGSPCLRINYLNGSKHGVSEEWIYNYVDPYFNKYFNSCNVYVVTLFCLGIEQGPREVYFLKNGQVECIMMKINFNDKGLREGPQVIYDPSGRRVMSIQYLDGYQDGSSFEYCGSCKPADKCKAFKETVYRKGLKEGISTTYSCKGVLVNMTLHDQGKKKGVEVIFRGTIPDRVYRTTSYTNGVKDGKECIFKENSSEEYHYISGVLRYLGVRDREGNNIKRFLFEPSNVEGALNITVSEVYSPTNIMDFTTTFYHYRDDQLTYTETKNLNTSTLRNFKGEIIETIESSVLYTKVLMDKFGGVPAF